ncbi:alpha/beta hydrolase [Lachnotalea glycerini]|uniref:Alpha/beta hydrolase n=1 Tax=Lachnotalea glycerini TaxID=1763509 RepID=A0A371JDU6_9FIRM|nr:alpha/beta hydrolase [Lachnotalea glycerini]RDY30940.1 alpha/beta hydrolase [Lachnotalea glycerini]
MLQTKDIALGNTLYAKYATIYFDPNIIHKAVILYFHGGGLLYGNRNDLPEFHLNTLVNSAYIIISFDYPLAPAAKIDVILDDICCSINYYHKHSKFLIGSTLPYFLWGRSAGSYLCLLAASCGKLISAPRGIISYYGYGFLCDNWFNHPSNYYCQLPRVSEACLSKISSKIHSQGNLDTHYSTYVYARQTGNWLKLFFDDREKYFYLNYTLRSCTSLPCPLFCAHSTNDTDVPFTEFTELSQLYSAEKYITSGKIHDFDRDETAASTLRLLNSTIQFLDKLL